MFLLNAKVRQSRIEAPAAGWRFTRLTSAHYHLFYIEMPVCQLIPEARSPELITIHGLFVRELAHSARYGPDAV